jgi:hypothetical protein
MNISRPTFGRILDHAHKTVADALLHGRALQIQGGTRHHIPKRTGPMRSLSEGMGGPYSGNGGFPLPALSTKGPSKNTMKYSQTLYVPAVTLTHALLWR